MPDHKKLLIFIDWFAPGYKAGGPIQSCVNLCATLRDEFDIYVLTTDTDHGETMPYAGINSNTWLRNETLGINIYYTRKDGLTTTQLYNQVAFVAPDFIYLNHLWSPYFVIYPLWLKYTGKTKAKVIVCPRGALYDSALSLKKYKKIPLLFLYKWLGIHHRITFHATNNREQAAIQKYFPGSEIMVADNLPDTTQAIFKSCTKELGYLNCIFIARIVPIKNLLFLLHILPGIKEQIKLTIVGPVEDELYWKDCIKLIASLPDNIVVHCLGPKKKDQLLPLIQENHLFVLPTTGENFGHSVVEALLAGRPVLISDQTPWLNLASKNVGWDLPLTEPARFALVIREMANADQSRFDSYARASWQFANDFIHNIATKNQYLSLFK